MDKKEVVVEMDNISMCFNLQSERVDNLKEYCINMFKPGKKPTKSSFWAIKDVSFQVEQGDAVGLIGTNGAGKSTALKIIAGVLTPTKGNVNIKGSTVPMIELGAGFDSELTAAENVYLNGLLLGMSRKEIDNCFDEIVSFSELEDFMNVPIKNFSSGMLARLGFSIATVRKPDILIVDEILAVGDFRFQEKCIKRVNELLSNNTTLLFVSHSIEDVKRLCNKAIWFEKGCIRAIGNSEEICNLYMQQ